MIDYFILKTVNIDKITFVELLIIFLILNIQKKKNYINVSWILKYYIKHDERMGDINN
jgi:hypothetical protein